MNPDLSLRDLANQIDIHPNHLSWLLNNSIGKNFNEFINQYRIEAFKSIAKAPENENLTIEGLAYESGFNSKTVFNTYFKRETGLTPKQFLKQVRFKAFVRNYNSALPSYNSERLLCPGCITFAIQIITKNRNHESS